MATIIATHMATNTAAAASQLCPGMRIHIIDIVQPPGMAIPSAIVRTKWRVSSTQTANTPAALR